MDNDNIKFPPGWGGPVGNNINNATFGDLAKSANECIKNVYPINIFGDELVNLSNQKSIDKCSASFSRDGIECQRAVERGLDFCKAAFSNNALRFLEKCVHEKVRKFTDVSKWKSSDYIKEIVSNTNIYLVTQNLCGSQTSDNHKIPSDTMDSCLPLKDFSWNDFKKLVNEDRLRDYKEYKAKKEMKLLGLYQNDGVDISSLDDIRNKTRIFIWIDHIEEQAKAFDLDYETLFTIVLMHEFAHALMDVYKKDNVDKLFRDFKEESLANAISLFACSSINGINVLDLMNVVCRGGFIESQPIQYQLALSYMSIKLLELCVPTWMDIKAGKIVKPSDIQSWYNAISCGPICKVENCEKQFSK